ncbi:penicillin-binding transpeptidase domain-containing protein [Georgenia sp. SYP-B2076]|uniref:penicillin-binding transpeptidase domain-containing protein n=1 Tax=Georgenia sp. SYP-B2076 TaxID=2495881 RepID=UPI001F0BB3CB|nr:penicillin-binding transpeptidase domain-containing protein [Georgenia sp. SYP-B2076]
MAALAGLVVLAGGLVACSPATPDPAGAAEQLAAALESGEVTGAPLDAGARQAAAAGLEFALADVADLPRAVVVAEIGEVDDSGEHPTASVELEWTWGVNGTGTEVSYRTFAVLSHDGDDWSASWSPALIHPNLGADGTLGVSRAPAARGEILGAGRSVLVTSRPVQRLGIDKANLDPDAAAGAAAALAEAVGLDDSHAYAERVAAAGPRAFVEAIVVRTEDPGDIDLAAVRRLPGVLAVAGELPLAPTSRFARPILGTVGQATAEIVEESGGAVRPGDEAGLSGLQRLYDDTLRGTPGTTMVIRHGDGTEQEIFRSEPTAGADVTLTLDARLQMLAEQVLEPVVPASAIVAVRPSTGEVLAAASGPGGDGLSTATVGAFAPGSTFKVVTALALLRSGLDVASPMECTPTVTAEGREFRNYPDFPAGDTGTTTLEGVVASSCNTALVAARDRVSAAELADAGASLGLGVAADLGVPSFAGNVPTDAAGTEHAASMIGQGRVEASPLAMATVATSVARGERVSPVLVTDVGGTAPAGAGARAAAPADDVTPLAAGEAQALQRLMRAVVVDGTSTFLLDVPGEPVSAKSGTAQYGTEVPPRAHAWMIAYRGDLAVAVFVGDGYSGAHTAGPLLEEFLRQAG